jgi:hypothetical protein
MLNRHLIRPVALGLMLALSVAPGVLAAASREGRNDASAAHCHDYAYPEMTCFATEAERDAAMLPDRFADFTTASTGYVVAYANNSYGGSSVVLSQDHGNLGFIGWADKISSYKVYTNLTGYFHEHTWYTGRVQSYCCNTYVSYVGDTLNNTFSSFDLP